MVVRLRVSVDRVGASAHSRNRDLALVGAVGQARGRTEAGATATGADIGVAVRVAGLQLADHVASVRLGARVLSLGALTEEVRQSDRGQDADDQDYDEELDQREAGLLRLNTRAELPQHSCDLLREDRWVCSGQERRGRLGWQPGRLHLGAPLALRPRLATGLPFTVALTAGLIPSRRAMFKPPGQKAEGGGPKPRLAIATRIELADYQLP